MTAHPDNHLFRALKAMAPEFTVKLSFAEQSALAAADPDKYWRYVDWVFGVNEPATQRWARAQTNRDFDVEYERDRT